MEGILARLMGSRGGRASEEGALSLKEQGAWGRGVFVALLCCLLALVLCSCSGAQEEEVADEPDEQLPVVQVDCTAKLAGPVMDLAETYNMAQDQVQVSVSAVKNERSYRAKVTYEEVADLVIAGDSSTVTTLEKEKILAAGSSFALAKDSLVIVAAEDSDITGVSKKNLKAGKYTLCLDSDGSVVGDRARQALKSMGLYGKGAFKGALASEGAVTVANGGAEVFRLVSEGQADIAIVLASSVNMYGGVKVVGSLATDTYSPIRYYAGIIADESPDSATGDEEANAFVTWCLSDADAQRIWKKWGITLAA